MSAQLHIGDVATLLGVSAKTIRHYHKVGLLAEPRRSESGYRLYTASDLVRLQRIRHLQALGLSLKQIKTVLGEHDTQHERTLREVLQALLAELASEIQALEKQRERIKALLEDDTLDTLETPPAISPTLEFVKEQLGEPPASISRRLLEMDMKIFSQLDAFNWPVSYHEGLRTVVQYIAEHPAQYQQMQALVERLGRLTTLPADAPEVDQLIAELGESEEIGNLLATLMNFSTHLPQVPAPFGEVLAEITNDTLSPALRRFFETISKLNAKKAHP